MLRALINHTFLLPVAADAPTGMWKPLLTFRAAVCWGSSKSIVLSRLRKAWEKVRVMYSCTGGLQVGSSAQPSLLLPKKTRGASTPPHWNLGSVFMYVCACKRGNGNG